MRVAVVGAGISGLVAARRLDRTHDVVLFEAAPRLGGHTNTVVVREGERPIPIDTGFIVFNTRTYPRFIALLGELGVGWAASEMSFSVRSDARDFEYAATGLSAFFTQRRRLAQPRHWRMVADTLRFFREARTLLAGDDDVTLGDWLRDRGYGAAFIDDHLVPMVRAVWSTTRAGAMAFPARFLVRFFDHHGFLDTHARPPWLTVAGGAASYVRAIAAGLRGAIRTDAPISSLVRAPGGGIALEVRGAWETFDHVIVACHADQALGMLAAPTPIERELLGSFLYQRNDAILHTDARVMPRTKRAWASWNVHLDDDAETDGGACLTYWMNRLQPLGATRDYFVTLNRAHAIAPDHVIQRIAYQHPIFTPAGVRAQARHGELIDHAGVSYCGAYWKNGFHEDGVVTAERVGSTLLDARRAAA